MDVCPDSDDVDWQGRDGTRKDHIKIAISAVVSGAGIVNRRICAYSIVRRSNHVNCVPESSDIKVIFFVHHRSRGPKWMFTQTVMMAIGEGGTERGKTASRSQSRQLCLARASSIGACMRAWLQAYRHSVVLVP